MRPKAAVYIDGGFVVTNCTSAGFILLSRLCLLSSCTYMQVVVEGYCELDAKLNG